MYIIPKESKYHYSRYFVGIWTPKVYTVLSLGPFGMYNTHSYTEVKDGLYTPAFSKENYRRSLKWATLMIRM